MDKWDFIKLKIFCSTKKWSLNWRHHHRVGENICQLYMRQRTDNQNIQGAQKIKLPQNQWTNKEMDNWTKQNFFKRRNSYGQKTHEKMLTISSRKGNANQNHTKIPPHPS
jgi:hypothetical protein